MTVEEITLILEDNGLTKEQIAAVERNYEESFKNDIPDACELVDPKIIELNEKRKVMQDLVETVEGMREYLHLIVERLETPDVDLDSVCSSIKIYLGEKA